MPHNETHSLQCTRLTGVAFYSATHVGVASVAICTVQFCELFTAAVGLYTVSQKSEPPKHFATTTANLHRFKWNFAHTRRHLFLSSTSNFIKIPYSVYEMFNSFKLLSQISVTDTTYFLLTSSVVTGVMSVRVDKQTTSKEDRVLIKCWEFKKDTVLKD